MFDLNLIFKNVFENKIGVMASGNVIKLKIDHKNHPVFDATYLNDFVSRVKRLFHYKPDNKELHIELDFVAFGDDAVVVYFELILKAIFDFGYNRICLKFPCIHKKTFSYPLYKSSLFSSENFRKGYVIEKEKYLLEYNNIIIDKESNFSDKFNNIPEEYFRIIVKNEGFNAITSRVGGFVLDYLKAQNLFDYDYMVAVVNVIMEIMDNVLSHTESDCLLSIKECCLMDECTKSEKIMLSIVILDLSENLIYTKIKENFLNKSLNNDMMNIAYNNHHLKFNSDYDFDFFAMISAFQKGITTRENAKNNSGRGLTKFIREIKAKAEKDSCYVYSGFKLLYFLNEYLNINEDGFIGFNDDNNYLENVPDAKNILNLKFYNPGTLYNLMLFYDRRDLSGK